MENKKLGLLILGVFMALGFFFASPVYAYWDNTHEYLTSEVINLYNKTAGDNAIPNNLRQYLYDGAKGEDADPRYINHYYDPVNNRGLEWLINGEASKLWANDRAGQQNIKYAYQPKTGLSDEAYKTIQKFYPTSDFTWNTALRYWINGDKEMAMETLGHVVHLVEDLGVPEHTRNDAHPDGSAYEIYTNKYSLTNPDKNFAFRLGDKKKIELGSLNDYLDSLARYSNKYFYSPKSIGISGGYESPEPDYQTAEIKSDRKYYVKNTDDEGQQYYLAAYNTIADIMTPYSWDVLLDKPLVEDSYWNLLSVRTVRTGAGVIDLFFKDVEKAKADPTLLEEKKVSGGLLNTLSAIPGQLWGGAKSVAVAAGSFFGSLFNSIGSGLSSATSFVGGLFANDNGLTDAGSVDLNNVDATADGGGNATAKTSPTTAKKTVSTKQADEIAALKLQIAGLRQDAQAQDETVAQLEKAKATVPETVAEEVVKATDVVADKTPTKSIATPVCAYASGIGSGQRNVVINEVAWMGGVRSAGDEWIELKNGSSIAIDVSGWQLINKGGGIAIRLIGLKNTTIKPGQFMLFERTDNNSAVGVTADLIYSGALGNTNDGLKLFDASCGIVDEVVFGSKWPAGDNNTKQTMERNSSLNGWHTSTSAGGTPKKENSIGVASVVGGGSIAGSGSVNQNGIVSSANTGRGGDSITPQIYPSLLITEVQLASASSTHDEFVKLYNPNATAVDLTGWYVQKKTKTAADFSTFVKADLLDGKQIGSHGFLTIAHPSSTIAYDVASEYGIADDNMVAVKNPNGDIVDKVGWGLAGDCEGACTVNPGDGQRIMRKYAQGTFVDTDNNANDFELSTSQTPVVLIENATTTQSASQTPTGEVATSTSASSTVYWNGGPQSGTVYDLFAGQWVGQRVHISDPIDIGRLEFGYYNDGSTGSVDAAIFNAGGLQQWTTLLAVPKINYGGYIVHDFSQALHLAVGDYFFGSRLVTGNIGIRKGYGTNPCSSAIYTTGNIPSCIDGDDVSMRIDSFVAAATSTASTTQSTGDASTGATTTAQFYPVVINEIMYDLPGADDGREWVELYNNGTSTVDIATWRLNENDTNHLLSIKQGTSTLPVGGYAVIANDSTKFLADNAGFSGVLFDSAFSLSNDGEAITLKNGDLTIDSVTYASSTGANGDGKTLQRFTDGWHAASSTPGALNAMSLVVETNTGTSTATTTDTTATSTATTTPQLPAQLVSTDKTQSGPVSAFYQSLAIGLSSTVHGFRVFAEGIAGRWQGGVCEFDLAWRKCLSNSYLAQVNADADIVSNAGKAPLTFTFPSDIVLSASKRYALFVKPTGSVSIGNRLASIYGSATDAYAGGILYRSEDAINSGAASIADMYFEMQ